MPHLVKGLKSGSLFSIGGQTPPSPNPELKNTPWKIGLTQQLQNFKTQNKIHQLFVAK